MALILMLILSKLLQKNASSMLIILTLLKFPWIERLISLAISFRYQVLPKHRNRFFEQHEYIFHISKQALVAKVTKGLIQADFFFWYHQKIIYAMFITLLLLSFLPKRKYIKFYHIKCLGSKGSLRVVPQLFLFLPEFPTSVSSNLFV